MIFIFINNLMAQSLTPKKLETVMKDVICPNCRYKFKTPRVAVYPNNSNGFSE